MTEKQRQQLHDVETRAQPLFRELARIEENIRYFRQRLFDAQDEKRKIESRLEQLDDEKNAAWADIFASMED